MGRAAEIFIEQRDGAWVVAKRGDDARLECGPQFLGASLVFVRALEEVGNRGRWRSFDFVEQACKAAGLGLQIHLDDDHNHHDLARMSDTDLISLIQTHHTGCGFAAYAWGNSATTVISEAKRRGWRVQMLVGEHAEQGAVLNYRPQQTFFTAGGVEEGAARFNTDVAEARQVFEILEPMIHMPGFADKAEAWMVQTYQDVVIALKGVMSADQITVLR